MKKKLIIFLSILLLLVVIGSIIYVVYLKNVGFIEKPEFVNCNYHKTQNVGSKMADHGSYVEYYEYYCYIKKVSIDSKEYEIEIRPYSKENDKAPNIDIQHELYNENGVRFGYKQDEINEWLKTFERMYLAVFEDSNYYYSLICKVNNNINEANNINYVEIEKTITEDLKNITGSMKTEKVQESDKVDADTKELHILISDENPLDKNSTYVSNRYNEIKNNVLNTIDNIKPKEWGESVTYGQYWNSVAYGRVFGCTYEENGETFYVDIAVLTDEDFANKLFNQFSKTNYLGQQHVVEEENDNYKAYYLNKENSEDYLKDNYKIIYKDKDVVVRVSYSGNKNKTTTDRNNKIEQNKKIVEQLFQKIESSL